MCEKEVCGRGRGAWGVEPGYIAEGDRSSRQSQAVLWHSSVNFRKQLEWCRRLEKKRGAYGGGRAGELITKKN